MVLGTAPTFIVSIAGASASGKTTLVTSLAKYIGMESHTHFDLDGYHLHARKERKNLNEYPEDPNANDFSRVFRDLKALSKGETILMPMYDHKKGTFSMPIKFQPANIVFVEGLHAGLINKFSGENIIDITIFLNPDEDLQKAWKVERDVFKRGYLYAEAIEQINKRQYHVNKYILPQAINADILINVNKQNSKPIKRRVLISYPFYYQYLENDDIGMKILEFFSRREITFKDKQFIEVRFNKRFNLPNVFGEEILSTGLRIVEKKISIPKKRYTYSEVVKILGVLLLTRLVQERIKKDAIF